MTTRADEKRSRFRDAVGSTGPVVMVGAHDAMSAKLIEAHGFDAVWVSGLGVSTMAHALPDLNLITMTEALDAAIRIDSATTLPVIADCDNGYGGLSNVVRTVREYERAGITGICIEDNLFPKRNSLYRGESASSSSQEWKRSSPAMESRMPAHAPTRTPRPVLTPS
jgi:phosphoenolpyruvate phosphomutase